MIIAAANEHARAKGIQLGYVLADARAIVPDLQVHDDVPEIWDKLLRRLAEWCIRFTPVVAVDPPDGLLLDASGCSHLWGGEEQYVAAIQKGLYKKGYDVRVGMAETPLVAWGVARYGVSPLVPVGQNLDALLALPVEALRLEPEATDRLRRLGLHKVRQFITIPRTSLRRRFGTEFLRQLDLALGRELFPIEPVIPIEPFRKQLPCLDPILTAPGIEIALQELLDRLCTRLEKDQKGLRTAVFKGYRVDGKWIQIDISTNRPTVNREHLFNLFALKLPSLEPGMGIELFVLEAPKVEASLPQQEKMWDASGGLADVRLSELIDRLANRVGAERIRRYLPDEHHWPERSVRTARSLQEQPTTTWPSDKSRPLQLLDPPERIEVTAPIPDYPPMLFRYKGNLHHVARADGPERIESEWWIEKGQHRDYYSVEDDDGHRYWLFRLGHYDDEQSTEWFMHGFFA
jgi:protein ImuB